MPSGMRYEKMLLRELIKQRRKKGELDETSYKIAIESLPKPLKRMFVHAYQSYLFNKAVSERSKLGINRYVDGDIIIDNEEHLVHEFDINTIDERIKNFEVHPTAPLYGTKVPLAGGVVGELEKKIINDEKITLEDFECPKTPKLGSHGLRRAIRFKNMGCFSSLNQSRRPNRIFYTKRMLRNLSFKGDNEGGCLLI